MVEVQQWWQIHNEMECVQNVKADIFHLRHWSNSECVGEEMMLPTEWRDVQRVTETEYVWSVKVDIFCLRHWPIEVSPDIHPPFKGVTTWHYWQYVAKRDGVKFRKLNLSRCSGEFPMKFCDMFWGMNIICWFPGVVFYSESFPFDQVAQFPIDHPCYAFEYHKDIIKRDDRACLVLIL